MNSSLNFEPNWSSPPGHTIRDILREKKISIAKFGEMISLSVKSTKDLLLGALPLSQELAQSLEIALGGSAGFWINREAQYREDLLRSKNILLEKKEWISKFPLQDMRKYGWITPSRNLEEKESSFIEIFWGPIH